MDELIQMKKCLTAQVQAQMGNLRSVDAKELGEAIDMIKDLAEAIYYCTVTEAMEGKGHEGGDTYYYTENKYVDPNYRRNMDLPVGRMYYDGAGSGMRSHSTDSSGGYNGMRDSREGRSPSSRKTYMESKEMHHDKPTQLKNLENYLQELTGDITSMIEGASPEEKQLLQKKISVLATKIV